MNFFIVGTSRSGSTLLRHMLASHPSVALLNESHWVPAMWNSFGSEQVPLDRLIAILEETHWDTGQRVIDVNLALSGRSWDELVVSLRRSLGATASIAGFHDAIVAVLFGHDSDAAVLGDKTPDYGFYMPLLQRIWPKARFIHMVRNWVDASRSMSLHPGCQLMISVGYDNWIPLCTVRAFEKYQRRPLGFAEFARSWQRRMNRIRQDSAQLTPGSYLEVSYSALLDRPELVLEQVAKFLALDLSRSWLHASATLVRQKPPTQPLRAHELEDLTSEDIRVLDSIDAQEGYRPTSTTPRLEQH